MRRFLWLGPLVGLSVLSVGVGCWMFRTQSVDNPALGILVYHFRWAKLTQVTVDVNRDGVIDAHMRVVGPHNRVGSTEMDVLEGWESSKLDGVFDIHYWEDEVTGTFWLELDIDCDGVFERRLEGANAKDRLLAIRNGQGQDAKQLAVPDPVPGMTK